MTGRVAGKVALITGAARGQGRSHAVRLAREGADIVAVDICADVESVPYPGADESDLAETARLVEKHDRRIVTRTADVRDLAALEDAVTAGVSEFGHIDIVVANAGIFSFAPTWELDETTWQTMIDVNLTGAWKTMRAVVPQMISQGSGGSIVLISAGAGLAGLGNLAHYTAAKHGVTGLMRTLSIELAPHWIRCNSVHTTTVDTDMVNNDATYALFMGGQPGATRADAEASLVGLNGLRIPWVEPDDVSSAVLYLASDDARYVTGTTHVVDAGGGAPYKLPHQ